jgi:uncharacterized protein YndB with AHSA1/START domain
MTIKHIEQDVLIEAPVEVVWRVVTEADQLSRWWTDSAEGDLGPGGHGTLIWEDKASHERAIVSIQVEEVEPNRLFSFRWLYPDGATADEDNSVLVEFRLVPEGDRTRLYVSERGLDRLGFEEEAEANYREEHTSGWRLHLGRLQDYARALADEVVRR